MYNFIDMHIHSTFSWDSEMEVDRIVEMAKENQISFIGLAEHLDFHSQHEKSYMFYNYDDCFQKIQSIKKSFPQISMGIEAGEPYLYKDAYEKYLENKKFDFILGSVHWIDDVSPVEDRYFYKYSTVEDAYKKYFEEEFKLVNYGNFDIVAHLTLVHRNGRKFESGFSYNKYKKEIDDILKIIIKKNIALEINCSGLRMAAGDFIPDEEIIKAYLNLGGNLITVGSDSHRYNQLFYGLNNAYELFNRLKIDEVVIYKERKPIKIKIKEDIKNEIKS